MFQIRITNYEKKIELLEQLITKLIYHSESNNQSGDDNSTHGTNYVNGAGLRAMVPFIQTIFSCYGETEYRINRCYKMHIELKRTKKVSNQTVERSDNSSETSANIEYLKILHFWCLNPAFR